MTFRIDSSNTQPPASGQGGPAAQSEPDVGVWRGANVRVDDDSDDVLTDAAEEISFSHSEHVESRKLEERELEEPEPLELPAIDSILAYLEATGQEDPQERLKQFVDELKRKASQDRDSDPGEEARHGFGDVTEQYLALSFAAQELAGSESYGALSDKFRTALQELDDEFGPVYGRISIRSAPRESSARATRVRSLPSRAPIGTRCSAGRTSPPCSKERWSASARRTIALPSNISSRRSATISPRCGGSSVQPARLNAVLQDLYSMEVLATMLEGCQKLIAKMATQHGVTAPTAGNLMQDLAGASGERWSNSSRFAAIADKYGATSPSSRVAFLGAVKAVVRDLPLKVFADADARSNVLDAAQGALDAAVTLEEES